MRYLVKPVTALGKAILRKTVQAGEAKNLINLEFESFRIKMDDEQYYDVLMLAQNFMFASRNSQYKKYRPPVTCKPGDDSERWFKYAVTCVLEKIKARNRTRLWISVIKRRQVRKKYVGIFKKKEVDGVLNEEEAGHIKVLEEMLSFEDIKFYRSLARAEMKEEKLIPFALRQQQQLQQQSQGGYLSRWWYGSKTGGLDDDSLVKDEDIKKFYETIEFDENARDTGNDGPRDSKLLEISFDLKTGSISLAKTDPEEVNRKTILSLQFINLVAHVIKRPDTLRAEVSLLDFSVIEKLTEFSVFPNLVRAKPATSAQGGQAAVVDETEELVRMAAQAKEPVLSFVMDEMAENSDADKSISFTMKPLEIVLNHQAANKIVDFVYGGGARDALETLASAAETHITALANKTRASLENALEEHKALDLSVDIDAPVIYIPFDCEDPAAFLLIADLGHIEVRSRLVSAAEKKEFSQKKRRKLTTDELSALYTLMYDVLFIRLNKIKLSYAASLQEWNQLILDPESLPEANRIIDDIDVNLSIATCIVPKALNLAQKKIYAKLPAVQLLFSDEKYKKIMKLIGALIPAKPELEPAAVPDHSLSNNAAIFELESSTKHSLSLSPQLGSTKPTPDTEDEFYDALESESSSLCISADDSETREECEAVSIDLLIEIEEICAKISRENKKYRKKDLFTLVAKRLKIACNVKPFNTVVNLILEAFFIRDDLLMTGREDGDGGGEEIYLASGLGRGSSDSSSSSSSSSSGDSGDSLLKVNVNLVDEKHPLFKDLYNAANIQVLLELAAINFFIDPVTLIQAAEFLDTMLENEKDYEIPLDPADLKRSKSLGASYMATGGAGGGALTRTTSRMSEPQLRTVVPSPSSRKPNPASKDGKKILLTAKLSELAVILGIGEDHFADIVLSSALAGVCIEADGDINFSGRIANFAILHKKRRGDGKGEFEFLRIDGENALEVNFQKIKIEQLVKLSTGALHFTYDSLFLEDTCNFAAKFALEAKVLETGKQERERKIKKAQRARYRLAKRFNPEDLDQELDAIAASKIEECTGKTTAEEESGIEETTRLKFEIDVSSPVLDFPHPEGVDGLLLSVFLGHIHSSNTFQAACDSQGNPLKSLGTQLVDQFIKAKLDAMRIELRSCDDVSGGAVGSAGPVQVQMCKLLEDVSIGLDISMIAKAVDRDYAATDLEGGIEMVRLKLARKQLKQVLNLAESLQKSLERALKPLDNLKKQQAEAAAAENNKSAKPTVAQPQPIAPQIVVDEHNPMPTAVELIFNVKAIELILYEEWEVEPLVRFALEDLSTNLIMQQDTSMILEQYISSICASDLRTKVQRKFKDIIIPGTVAGGNLDDDDVKFKYEKTSQGDSIVKVEVNAPKVVLSMDLINSLAAVFANLKEDDHQAEEAGNLGKKPPSTVLKKQQQLSPSISPIESTVTLVSSDGSPSLYEEEINGAAKVAPVEPPKTFILAEIGQLELYILEEPDSASSEAMKLSVRKITFAQQTNMSLSIDGVSAAFVNMDNLGSVVQFIDPFDVTSTVELASSESEKSTQIWAVVKPIIIRFSYQDIQFFTKLSEQFSKKPKPETTTAAAAVAAASPTNLELPAASELLSIVSESDLSGFDVSPALSSLSSTCSAAPGSDVIMKVIEQVQVNLEGIRVVFIDDFTNVHIPLIDLSVDRIAAEVKDWSGALKVNGILKLHGNFFNRINSNWEPIIEPWSLDLSVLTKGKMSEIVVSSEKALEIIASHSLLDSLLSVGAKIAVAKPRAASSYREVSKPYLIKNYTGHVLSLWSDVRSEEVVEIACGAELPFEFEDWKAFRSSTKSKSHRISLHLMESPWESIKNVSVDQQGLFVFPLRPKLNSISHKLVCEVQVIAGVRNIILRSATCFKNDTSFDLEIADIAAEKYSDSIVIKSGTSGSLPINFSAGGAFKVRPVSGYNWSQDRFDLWELLHQPQVIKRATVQCGAEVPETATPFFLKMFAKSDTPEDVIYASSKKVSSNFYALGTITFSPTLEIENLLPFDFSFRIYDHDAKYDFSGTLQAGQMNPLHGIDTKHVIGLSLEIPDQQLKTKQVAVINNGKGTGNCDKTIQMTDANGIEAKVFIDYE